MKVVQREKNGEQNNKLLFMSQFNICAKFIKKQNTKKKKKKSIL